MEPIECFPLPSAGCDAFFGFGRTFWMKCEKRGLIKLRRLQFPNAKKAVSVCVPYADAKAMLEQHGFIPGGHRDKGYIPKPSQITARYA
jgi:hypothetical protein